MIYKINVGDRIPEFEALDQNEEKIRSKDILGTPSVIYFYPKDDTPGCTKEACSLRDNMERIKECGVEVIGVSPDSAASHQKFIKKYHLNYNLIADQKQDLCKKFDIMQKKLLFGILTLGIERSTFLIDSEGIIQWIERPVTVEGHVDRIIAAINQYI